MLERFTESARQTLLEARREAVRQGSGFIEPAHLLVGLLTVRGLSIEKLSDLPRSVDSLCTAPAELDTPRSNPPAFAVHSVRVVCATEQSPPPAPGEAFSQETQHVLNYAAWEADQLHHRHVGTEHLLLGLLDCDDGRTENLLTKHGLDLQAIRETIAEHTVSLRHQVRTLDDALIAVERLRRLILQRRDASPPSTDRLLTCIREELDTLNGYFR